MLTMAGALLRRYLNEGQRHRLWKLRARTMSLCTRVSTAVFDLFPISLAASIKEGIKITGQLDYPDSDIWMDISSSVQVDRLRACKKEPETIQWLKASMGAGDTLYDVGANVGAYSFVAFAVAAGECMVYAFEPSFTTFAALCENIILNRCHERVVALPVALSNKTRLTNFVYSSLAPGAALHLLEENMHEMAESPSGFSQLVLDYRLDDFVLQFDLPRPNLLKLDVDGAELRVLDGAEKTLSGPQLRSILVEVDEAHQSAGKIVSDLERKGFQISSMHAHKGPGTVANYIFERLDNVG